MLADVYKYYERGVWNAFLPHLRLCLEVGGVSCVKIVNRWFFVWQEDKERAFLEDMAVMGYVLEKVGMGRYEFWEDEAQLRTYQFDFRGLSRIPEEEYL